MFVIAGRDGACVWSSQCAVGVWAVSNEAIGKVRHDGPRAVRALLVTLNKCERSLGMVSMVEFVGTVENTSC